MRPATCAAVSSTSSGRPASTSSRATPPATAPVSTYWKPPWLTVTAAAELVEAVREIWQQVLGIERIELHDDLFELGGHSLTITRIIALMQQRLGVDVPLDDLFDNPTIIGALDAAGLR